MSTSTAPYEGDMSPFLTAAQFGDHLAPWFYAFAVPIDIPFGAFLGRFGGKFVGRLGTTRVGRWIPLIKGAIPSSQIVEKTAYAVNQELLPIGYTDAPFAVASKVLAVTVDDATAAALNALFSGDLELVRTTASQTSLVGPFWTTREAISDVNGLVSAAGNRGSACLERPARVPHLRRADPGRIGTVHRHRESANIRHWWSDSDLREVRKNHGWGKWPDSMTIPARR